MGRKPDTRTSLRRAHPAPTVRRAEQEVEPVYCPECGMPAWIEWVDAVASTAGAVEHAKVRCFARHWFLLPLDYLRA